MLNRIHDIKCSSKNSNNFSTKRDDRKNLSLNFKMLISIF